MNVSSETTKGVPSLATELGRRLRAGRGPRTQMVLADKVVDLGPADGIPVVIYLRQRIGEEADARE